MPSIKSIIITILIALLIAGAIFYLTGPHGLKLSAISHQPSDNKIQITDDQHLKTEGSAPKPTLPPLDSNSNLESEINQLQIPDSSSDFQSLKNEANNF